MYAQDIESSFNLIARVYRQAIREAKHGNMEAIAFLDVTCPDWRERVNRYPGLKDKEYEKQN